MTSSQSRFLFRWRYSFAALIGVAGVLSRIYILYFARPLWLDEEMVLLNVRDRTYAELGGALWLNQSAPVGWLAAQRAVLHVFGLGDRTGRDIPVLFGIATIGLAFWAGRRWLGPVGATVFVLLCSFASSISFFNFEAKQYSADVFGALLLLVLGIWALEPAKDLAAPNFRRILSWWGVASLAHWFSYGAMFVTPACALVIVGTTWRRADWTRAARAAAPGLLWAGSFALNYWWSIRYTSHSDYLQSYWHWAFPPAGAGALQRAGWLLRQLKPLAKDPGGSPQWIAFWALATSGMTIAMAADLAVGLLLLAVPLSAFVFGALRLVPLSGRLSLWMVPALYVGIAIAADTAARCATGALAKRRWVRLLLAGVAGVTAINLCLNIYRIGKVDLFGQRASTQGLNDHAAVRFLMNQRERGDVFLGTHLTLPAIWWYGGVNLADPNRGRYFENDAAPIFEMWHEQNPLVCARHSFSNGLAGAPRVDVYLGFDSDIPPGFRELVLDSLSQLGTMIAYRRIQDGAVAVFDLRLPPKPWSVLTTRYTGETLKPVVRPAGCVGLKPALRW